MLEIFNPILSNFDIWASDQIANNEFLIGMVTTAVLTMGAYLTRTLPRRFIGFLYKMSTTEITFNSDDDNFDIFAEYVLKHVIVKSFQRTYNLQFDDGKNILSPGYGNHFGWVLRRPCWVNRSMMEGSATDKFKEQLTLTVAGRSRKRLERILMGSKEFIEAKTSGESVVKTYINSNDWWSNLGTRPKRTSESIILEDGVWEGIEATIDKFLASEDDYLSKGIPYHLGIFLDGKPGCGKSSLIHVIASHYDRNIRYLDLNSVRSEHDLYEIVGKDWSNDILVIEDIDATRVQTDRDGDDEGRLFTLNLSTLLNVLDGIASPHGMIVLATSNHKDRLDPALIRKGRFDYQVEIGYLSWNMWMKMCVKFDRASPITKEEFVSVPPVDASHLLHYETDAAIKAHFERVRLNADSR